MNHYAGGYQPTPSPAAPQSVSTYDNPSSNNTYASLVGIRNCILKIKFTLLVYLT